MGHKDMDDYAEEVYDNQIDGAQRIKHSRFVSATQVEAIRALTDLTRLPRWLSCIASEDAEIRQIRTTGL